MGVPRWLVGHDGKVEPPEEEMGHNRTKRYLGADTWELCPLCADFVAEVAEREACRTLARAGLKVPFAPLERWV
jgi:hypothetical protein